MRNGKDPDYSQYEKNNLLSFAVASMMFEQYTHVIVRRRRPGHGVEYLGGGDPVKVIKRFGNLHIESALITPDGLLQITVI